MTVWQKLSSYLGIAALLSGVGFGMGWWACQRSATARQAKVAQAQVALVTAQTQAVINKQVAQVAAQADASAALTAQQAAVRAAASDIHLEIEHAVLVPAPAASASTCPDVLGSAEFQRLYERAADPAAASSIAAGSR